MNGGSDQQRQPAPTSSTFGFTPAQQIMFPGSSVNGQQVVVVTPEVARSLGIVAPSDGGRGTEASVQVHQDTAGDVSVSLLDSEADGMMDPDQFLAVELASGKAEVVVDEDLASLSWLHGKSLFKTAEAGGRRGVPLPAASHSGESPTSDYAADSPDPADGGSPRPQGRAMVPEPAPEPAAAPAVRPAKARRVPPHLDYDPKVHVTLKPPFSFSCLIFMSIEDSPNRGRPVKDIYRWILDSFPFYRDAPIGWKNSVRHNLSLNKCFRKVLKVPSVGKGSLWTVEPEYRSSLIQALRRSPCVQASSAPRPWTAAASADYVPATVLARPEAPHKGPVPVAHPARRSAGRGRRGRGVAVSPQRLPIIWDPSPAPEPAVRPPAPRVRVVGQDATSDVGGPAAALTSPLPRSPGVRVKAEVKEEENDNLPCPQLFPFLSRCLLTGAPGSGSDRAQQVAAPVSEADDNGEEQKLVIVQDPPTPTAVQQADGRRGRPRDYDHDYGLSNGDRPHPRLLVISRCPEQEHTYARWPQQRHCPEALDSDDEAFSDDSNLSHEHGQRVPCAASSARSVEEGADLLLSLAGVPLSDGRVSDAVTPAGGSGRPLTRGPAASPR